MPDHQPFSTFTFAITCPLFLGSLLYTFYGSKVSFTTTIVTTFAIQALILILIPFLANIGGAAAYWYCFSILSVYGLFFGIGQTCISCYNSKLPSSYIAIFLTSHGLSGIAANMLRLTGLSIWPTATMITNSSGEATSTVDDANAFKSCLFMLLISSCVVLLCIPAQFILVKNEFANYYFFEKDLTSGDVFINSDCEG